MSLVPRLSVLRRRVSSRLSACTPALKQGYSQNSTGHDIELDHSASSKLFEDAAREAEEEAEVVPKSSVISMLETKDDNWTGDEPVQHAVLRMLVDKYKPLRGGSIRSADDKLKQAQPQVRPQDPVPYDIPGHDLTATSSREDVVRRYVPGEPILPGIPGHQPWHTTFTVPSHATSSVKYGNIPPIKASQAVSTSIMSDEKAQRKQREAQKRMEQGTRLSRARESTLDYRFGIKGGAAKLRRPNPVSLKGWANLVEDRIEKARLAGYFNSVKGRGQPIASAAEGKNPFIGREEYLMNRIVQRQGAVPPWVEVQGELEASINTFREILKQSWTRRVLRTLTAMHPAALLPKLTLADVITMRDQDWEEKECGYHETALEEVNSLVRKYNGLAPYAVRRAYYMRNAELERAYREAGQDILRGIEERARRGLGTRPKASVSAAEDDGVGGGDGDGGMSRGGLGLRAMFREMLAVIRGRQ